MSQIVIEVIRALQSYGGEARCEDVYAFITKQRATTLTEGNRASIRATLQRYNADAPQYDPSCPNLFSNPTHEWWAIRRAEEIKPVQFKPNDVMPITLARLAYQPERFNDEKQVAEEMMRVVKETLARRENRTRLDSADTSRH